MELDIPYTTIVEALTDRAQSDPDALSFIYVSADGREQRVSRSGLIEKASMWAEALERAGVRPNDLLTIVVPPSPNQLYCFVGAILLGATPSIYPYITPRNDPDAYALRLRALVETNDVRYVIASDELSDPLSAALNGLACTIVNGGAGRVVQDAPLRGVSAEHHTPDQVAFVQFSSGTTGAKKGVPVTHRMVVTHTFILKTVAMTADPIVVTWLPMHHDMGLIGSFFVPLLVGVPTVMMSPYDWARNPKLLLLAMDRYRATHTFMPNFAYSFLVRGVRPKRIKGIDLSSMRYMLNGAEPLRPDIMQAFIDRYVPFGLDPTILKPAYGMAENTLGISLTSLDEPMTIETIDRKMLQRDGVAATVAPDHPDAIPMVASGRVVSGTELRVIGDDGHACGDREVGEIQIRGSSLFSGYYKRPDLTEAAFDGDWFKTGDLGYTVDGLIYVTGREKDLIIVGGKNIHPEDIESIADGVDGIRPGRAVAFAVSDERTGTENVVVVAEVRTKKAEAQAAIRNELEARVVRMTEVTLADVRFVRNNWVLTSSSGKLARAANREKYLAEFGD